MPGRRRSEALKRSAIREYLDCGTGRETAKRLGLHESTISYWRKETWWPEIQAEVLADLDDVSKAKYRRLVNAGQDVALERLAVGDPHVLGDGQVVLAPVTARNAMLVAAVAYDKLRLAEGRPSRIVQDSTRINALVQEFAAMGQAYRKGQVIEQLPDPMPKSKPESI